MELETIIPLVVTLVGTLGVKEAWNIWNKKIESSNKIKSSIREDNKERITELEDKIDVLHKKIESLLKENASLAASVARLEERVLLTAKNRVKSHIDKP